MESFDGNLWKSEKIERTRIVPLRKISNWLTTNVATDHLLKHMDLNEAGDYGWRYKYHGFMWTWLNKPYEKWGTYYKLDLDAFTEWFAENNES